MAFRYYPGCTLKTQGKELDIYARKSMEALDVDVKELEEWQCCGTVYPLAQDEIGTRLSAVRALEEARRNQCDLLTLCSACHHVIKRVNNDMSSNTDIRTKVNNYLTTNDAKKFETPYEGETKVVHFLEMLRDFVGFDELKKKVTHPLTGRKIGAYYGCLLLRPSAVMKFDDPENPSIMEDFILALGGEPVIYSCRNECCGAYIALEEKELTQKLCDAIMESVEQKKAEALVTACPLCRYNLQKNASKRNAQEGRLPVFYFTELLAEALGVK
jgi:heterodisulfide reductase subunit B